MTIALPRSISQIDWQQMREKAKRFKSFAFLPDEPPHPSRIGPLSQFSFGIKDIIGSADMPTRYGSRVDTSDWPRVDSAVVERIRAAGGTIFGKTATTEFACGGPSEAVNPHNTAHTPGGSSSGSAAAVAAGFVSHAIGTQTIGSIIRPAAFCGVVGFKPSFGSIVRTGAHPTSWSLDHIGIFARTVGEISAVFPHLVGNSPCDPHGFAPDLDGLATGGDMRRPRVALLTSRSLDKADRCQRDAIENAAERLRQRGALVAIVRLSERYERTFEDAKTILSVEANAIFEPVINANPNACSPELKHLVASGSGVSAATYVATLRRQAALRAEMAKHFEGFDALLTVPALGEAPYGLSYTGDPLPSAPWSFIGAPAIAIPFGNGPNGLPLGVQLVAPWLQDVTLLRTALFAEKAFTAERKG